MDIDEYEKYSYQEKYQDMRICSKCVEDPDLENFINRADGEPGCDFCGNDDAPTCAFLVFIDHVKSCIEAEYAMAENHVGWMSSEGGWIGEEVWDTWDLIADEIALALPRDDDQKLFKAIIDSLESLTKTYNWCVAYPYGSDSLEWLRLGWVSFTNVIKFRTRFFLDRIEDKDHPTPKQMLDTIGDHIVRLELFRKLETGTNIYRARHYEDGKKLETPAELGPPTINQAVMSNRMSPPGIVMFYGALDAQTALLETTSKPGKYAIGRWRVNRSLWLLDYTRLPEIPGFFASIPETQMWSWRNARFFNDLVDDFSKPISRDDRIHIEYIPTQVVTEYCRLELHKAHATSKIDGIIYPSSRNDGHEAIVLFADRSAVVGIRSGENNQWLELMNVEDRDY